MDDANKSTTETPELLLVLVPCIQLAIVSANPAVLALAGAGRNRATGDKNSLQA